MNTPNSFLNEITAEAMVDEVGLWLIIGEIRDEFGVTEPRLLRETTLRFVRELLATGHVVAGYYKPDGTGIDVWDLEPESVVAHITRAWDELGREPNIGEIVVFIGKHLISEDD